MGRGSGKGFTAGLSFDPVTSNVCCVILVVLLVIVGLLGMGFAKVVMGAVYFSDCNKRELIPVYLIASGVATVLLIGLYKFKPSAEEKKWKFFDKLDAIAIAALLGTAFYFVWLFYGCFLVFGSFSDIIDGCPAESECCNKDLIKFSLFTIIVDLIVCAALIVGLVLLVAFVCLSKPLEHSRLESAESRE